MRLIHVSHGVGVRVATNFAIKNECLKTHVSHMFECMLFVLWLSNDWVFTVLRAEHLFSAQVLSAVVHMFVKFLLFVS